MSVALIIAAGGIGARFSSGVKKQFFEIDGKPILYYTISNMLKMYKFDEIVIGFSPDDVEYIEDIMCEIDPFADTLVVYAESGATRAETVLNCVNACQSDMLVIHDAVRPFVSAQVVSNVIEKATEHGGAICALKAVDTIKHVEDGVIKHTIDRDYVYMAHTPQAFKKELLHGALQRAINEKIPVTDEASVMEYAGHSVAVVESSRDNIKITTQDDISAVNMLKIRYFKG